MITVTGTTAKKLECLRVRSSCLLPAHAKFGKRVQAALAKVVGRFAIGRPRGKGLKGTGLPLQCDPRSVLRLWRIVVALGAVVGPMTHILWQMAKALYHAVDNCRACKGSIKCTATESASVVHSDMQSSPAAQLICHLILQAILQKCQASHPMMNRKRRTSMHSSFKAITLNPSGQCCHPRCCH